MNRTQRGFAIYARFRDRDGTSVRVQRSSSVGPRKVWVFIEPLKHHVTGDWSAGAHLSRGDAMRLVKALNKFLDGAE
jgi:hypothetical protein